MLCHSISVFFPFEPMNLRGFLGRKFDDFYLLQQIFSKNRFGTLPKKKNQPSHGIWGGFKLTTSSSCWKTINSPMQQESGYVLEVAYEKLENHPNQKTRKITGLWSVGLTEKTFPFSKEPRSLFWSLKKWSAVLHTMSQKTVDASEIPRSPVWYVECTD